MYKLEVGRPYIQGVTRWPEAVEYNYRAGAHELRMFINRPSLHDIEVAKSGLLKFHLYVRDQTIFFVYEFHHHFAGGCAYSWHLVPEAERTLPPELRDGERDVISILLIDARTGILKAIRVSSFSHRFSVALGNAIREQAAKPFDQDHHNNIVNDEYTRRPVDDMIKASYVSCRAGD